MDISIAGNIGQDPVLRYGASGKAFTTLSVAVTTGRDDTKETHWFDVKCFDELAENMAELGKGQRVIVKGRMKQDKWEDKETGQNRSKFCVYADEGGPSLRWNPREGGRSSSDKVAAETVQRGFEDDTRPF